MTAVHPNEVLHALLERGMRSDKQEKLKKLHELCSLEYSRHSQGARDLSLSNMSKVAELKGLFKARTIYNSQSSDYVTLINAWDSYNGPKEAKSKNIASKPNQKYSFLEKIEDSAIRALCLIAFAERDKLKAELNLLKSQTHVVVDMRPLGATLSKTSGVAVIEVTAQLTDSERSALTKAVSKEFLLARKWKEGDDGEIIDERGRFVFLPGFTSGIYKAIRMHK